jgi:hypothetical protein
MRQPNEIDFWRGFALVTIFVNHIPGLYFERFTYRNLSLSDSAELFVFLAGWSLRLLVEGPVAPRSTWNLVQRLLGRAFGLYIAQTFITEIAIAMLAGASIALDAPFLLDWHNASAVFREPVEAHVGLVLLTHQLGYFNILPLYVVLMTAAPLIGIINRFAKPLLLPVSISLYVVALTLGINFPTWPIEGTWFLNPLTWQFIYILGFLMAGTDGIGAIVRRHRKWLRFIAFPVLVTGIVIASHRFSPDPIKLPEPKLFFMFDKTFLSPARLVHILALVVFFAGLFKPVCRWLPLVTRYLSLLGRNSLNVFCVASLLSLLGQVYRFAYGGLVATDTFMVICGLLVMGLAAWISEWRDRVRIESAGAPAEPSASPPASSSASA